MSKLFIASYRGYCRTCRDDIDEGEEMGYDSDDQIVCKDCWGEEQEALGYPDDDEGEEPIRSDWRDKR